MTEGPTWEYLFFCLGLLGFAGFLAGLAHFVAWIVFRDEGDD